MRATVLLVTVLLVVGAAAPLAAAAPGSGGSAAAESVALQAADNETDNETAPGARLAGVVAVQGAEVEGEVERRSFGEQIRTASSNASRASVVARYAGDLDERLDELRERKQTLEADRENVSASRYHAEMAELSARIGTLQQLTNATAATARGLPADVREERGVNVTAIERLRTAAGNLSGPEIAAIARDIAGPPGNRSGGPPAGIPGNVPDVAENATDGNTTDFPGSVPDVVENVTGRNTTDRPGNVADAVENVTDGTATAAGTGDDTPGNAPGASGDGPGANNSEHETSDEPGRPDDAGGGNGNGPPGGQLLDLSALASLLP